MIRSLRKIPIALIAALTVGFATMPANAQQAGGSVTQPSAGTAQGKEEFPGKQELLRRIALYEGAERSAETAHAGTESLANIYGNLAALYEDAGMYPKSEDVMRREISLLRSGSQDELADAIGHIAVLHIAMGELREAEKEQLEALRIRETIGDPVEIALSWTDLADVYIKQLHYRKALGYSQKAVAVLADNPKVDVANRIAVRQTLAYALCGLQQCGEAIPLLKAAIELEKSSYGADSLMVGTGNFLLGYAYWQYGDMQQAAELMARGAARMKVDLGWGHAIYLNAMMQYAKFLRQRGQMEAAASAEREIKMANAVVDARSLTTSSSAFAGAGSR
jgi:tetratricopeptide (TPR) repeat protein